LGFSLRIGAPGSHVPHESLNQDRAVYLPATAQPVSRSPLDFFTDPESDLISMAVVSISTAHQRFTRVRLPGPHLTEFLPAFSRSVHHLGSYPHAAPGGLRTGPATRPRGAHPHLPCSTASVSRSARPPFSAFVAHSRDAQARPVTPHRSGGSAHGAPLWPPALPRALRPPRALDSLWLEPRGGL